MLTSPPPPSLTTVKMLIGSLMAGVVVIGFVFTFIVPPERPEAPIWAWAVVAAAALGSTALALTLGFRVAPLPPELSVDETSRRTLAAVHTTSILRAAVCEAPGLIAAALAVSVHTLPLLFFGLALALILVATIAWPGSWALGRLQRALEADGARTGLDQFGTRNR